MVYLSYIVDHYDNLSDVNMFLHSHRFAWHNNELLGGDSVEMVSRLFAERVQREGFMYVFVLLYQCDILLYNLASND
jgi:hypothetical protein